MLAKLPLLQQLSVKGAPLAADDAHREHLLVRDTFPCHVDGVVYDRVKSLQFSDGQEAAS